MSDSTVMTIVAATANQGKLGELRALLADLPIDLRATADALGSPLPVAETGQTFEENAVAKAHAVAEATHMVTIADDSGLEVDALGGRPGVRSARFAGEAATDADNNALLLEQLQDVDEGQRTARFRCAIALCDPWDTGNDTIVEGRCEGTIARSPSGTGGFGYDPLFVVAGVEGARTMAELALEEKNHLSHRARALAALRPKLEQLLRQRLGEAVQAFAPASTPP
jgi:XTP/dITP diphosphohydrolase